MQSSYAAAAVSAVWDSRGAKRLITEALAAACEVDCTGIRLLRRDSQFNNADVVAACRQAGAHFSLTTRMNPSIKQAIASRRRPTGLSATPGPCSTPHR